MGSDDIKKRKILENKQRRKNRKLARRVSNRQTIPKILILTEGLSEEKYFKSLKISLKLNTVIVEKSTHTDSVGIILEAIEYGEHSIHQRDEYNLIFCVFDLDTVNNRVFLSHINGYNSKYSKFNSVIYPIFSFPCIEFWFILHYKPHSAPFSNASNNSIGENVKNEFKNYRPDYYETNDQCIYEISCIYKTAINNAETVMRYQLQCESDNPITNIHQLMRLLDNIHMRTNKYEYKNPLDSFILKNI